MKSAFADLRLLIVDDDPSVRSFLEEHLSARGFQTESASSAGEAILKLMERRYQMAIMDVRMPLMDGVSCLKQCRSIDPDMPILMISGEATLRETMACFEMGAVDFMEKPLRMARLFHLIEKALGRRALAELIGHYRQSHNSSDGGELIKEALHPIARMCGADSAVAIRIGGGSSAEIVSSLGDPVPADRPMTDLEELSTRDEHLIIRPLSVTTQRSVIVLLKRRADHEPFGPAERAEADLAINDIRLALAA